MIIAVDDYIDRLIYEESDYDGALDAIQKVYKDSLIEKTFGLNNDPRGYRQKFANYLNLLENYRDFDGIPLKLYFKADKLSQIRWRERHTAVDESIGDLYGRIVKDFPQSRITGYAYMLWLRQQRDFQRHHGIPEGRDKTFHDRISQCYDEIVSEYWNELFPVTDNQYLMVQIIGPFAIFAQAEWWHYTYAEFDRNQAIERYEMLVDLDPAIVFADSVSLAAKACYQLLEIYDYWPGDKRFQKYRNNARGREICYKLLNDLPNFSVKIHEGEGGSVQTQPEALLHLAELEESREAKISALRRLIYQYPISQAYLEDPSFYCWRAYQKLKEINSGPHDTITELKLIVASNLPDYTRAAAQFMIGDIVGRDLKDQQQASVEYQFLIDEFKDSTDGYTTRLVDRCQRQLDYMEQTEKQ